MSDLSALKEQTMQLKAALEQLKEHFDQLEAPIPLNDREQFMKMKQKTTAIYELLEAWETHALKLIQAGQLNIIPQQIIAAKENIELIIPHSYYKDIRRRRYMEYNRSCHYIFNQLLAEIEEKD